MSRPRLLLVHQGGELYGSDLVFLQVVDALSSQGECIVVLDTGGPLVERLESVGADVYVRSVGVLRRQNLTLLGVLRTMRSVLEGAWRIRRIIKVRKIDLVYSNTLGVLGGLVAARIGRVPHVHHVHEIVLQPLRLGKFLAWVVRNGATHVIANSEATARYVKPKSYRERPRLTVVHNAIDTAPFVRAPDGVFRQELGIDESTFLIAMVGRINAWKGHDYLLEAVSILRQSANREFAVAIVGGVFDGYEDLIRQLEERIMLAGLEDRVHLLGVRDDVPSIMKNADVAVVPSMAPEPFGLVVLEAMAAGTPVIATAHGGPTEILEDGRTGYLVSPSDPNEMASRLKQLMGDPALSAQLSVTAAAVLEERFSLSRAESAYRRVVLEELGQDREGA